MPVRPVVLITGAAKGLGFETARLLGQRGYHVLVGARNRGAGTEAVERLASEGTEAEFVRLDVLEPEALGNAAARIEKAHGRLDVLINNAAILLDHYQPASATSAEQLRLTLETNVVGAHAVLVVMAPLLRRSPTSRVVNVSSGAGQLCDMAEGVWAPAYQVSKAALNALTCLWAAEFLADGIPVNSVCPGWCRTDMGGASAARSAVEGALGIAWVASEAPREITAKFWRDRAVIAW